MENTHKYLVILKMDGKTIAVRENEVTEYNDNIVYSMNLNTLMKDICRLIEDRLKEKSIDEAYNIR